MEPQALINALSHPDAYPDRPSRVSVRQTHISSYHTALPGRLTRVPMRLSSPPAAHTVQQAS